MLRSLCCPAIIRLLLLAFGAAPAFADTSPGLSRVYVPSVMGPGGLSHLMDSPAFSFVEVVRSSPVVYDTPSAYGGETADIVVAATGEATSGVTVPSGAPTFLSEWSYRKIHAISGSPDGDLTDYQMRFVVWRTEGTDSGENVYVGTLVKEDYSDLRFTTIGGVQMPYWIESVGASNAVVWVKVPSIPRAGTQVVMDYGNSQEARGSDGSAVFEVFDDIEGGSILSGWSTDTGVSATGVKEGENTVGRFTSNGQVGGGVYRSWTQGTGVLEYSIKLPQNNAYHTISAFSGHASGVKGAWTFATNKGSFGAMAPTWMYYTPYSLDQWYTVRMDLKGNGRYDLSINEVKVATDLAYYGSTTHDRIGIIGWTTGGQAFYDNIRVRPYLATQPDVTGWDVYDGFQNGSQF